MYAVKLTDLPEAFRRKQPRCQHLPAVLIRRLAVDLRFGWHGLGTNLLLNALEHGYQATQEDAALAVVAEANNDRARLWYGSFGFESFPDSPDRRFMPMATVSKLITGM